MTTVLFKLRTLDGLAIPNTNFKIEAGYPNSVVSPLTVLPAAVSFTTDDSGNASVNLVSGVFPYFLSRDTGGVAADGLVGYKFFVPDSVGPLEADMLYVDLSTNLTAKSDATLQAMIEAKTVVLTAMNQANLSAAAAKTSNDNIIMLSANLQGGYNAAVQSAASSAAAATTSAGQASTSAQAAAGSASAASTSAGNAAGSASAAAGSASSASTSAGNAAGSATAANTSAGNAAGSASAASTSAGNANTSAQNAATSAATAQNWATKTDTEVLVGQGYGAKKYANDASGSATAAAGSASAANTSAGNAATSLSNFQNQYQGPLAAAPTKRKDNSALLVGDLYFDTATGMRVYSSTGWVSAGSSVNGTAKRGSIVATAGQTVFPIPGGFDSGFIDVYLDGVKQVAGSDVTTNASPNVTLTVGAMAGQTLDYVAYGTFAVANTYDQPSIDAKMNALQFRNKIINGSMQIDQRNNGAAITPVANTVTYSVDRWKFYGTQASKVALQRGSGNVAMGFVSNLTASISAAYAPAGTDQFLLYQSIEGSMLNDSALGTANAKAISLSFLAYSSIAGTHSGSLRTSDNSRSCPFTFTIPTANNWTLITLTLPGDTVAANAWNNIGTTSAALDVMFNLGSGATMLAASAGAWQAGNYQGVAGSVQLVNTVNAIFAVTNVQLEFASAPSAFERRPLGIELSLCQRYYEADWVNIRQYCGSQSLTGLVHIRSFAEPKRGVPTVTLSNLYSANASNLRVDSLYTGSFRFLADAGTANPMIEASASFAASAEL